MSLKLVKRHGQRNWYIRGSVRGIAIDKSTLTDNEAAADAIRIKEESRLLNRSVFGEKASVLFVEAAVQYMEQGGETRFLQPIIDYFKGSKLADISQVDIDAAARAIYPSAAPATINRQIHTPISAILKMGAKRKWCDSVTIERPTQPKGRIRWLRIDEAERLVECAADHLKPLLRFLFGTGARISEALALQWSDVDLKKCHAIFQDTKNGERRGVPLPASVVASLSNLKHRVGPVFLTNKGKPYLVKSDGGGQVKKAFATACRRAAITDFTPHDCRHTFATWHYAKHRNIAELMQICGWKSPNMALRYAHANVENLLDGVNALGW
jgi:integrase